MMHAAIARKALATGNRERRIMCESPSTVPSNGTGAGVWHGRPARDGPAPRHGHAPSWGSAFPEAA